MEKASYNACLYHDGLAEPLQRFIQRAWPKDAATQSGPNPLLASKPDNQRSPTFLFLKGEEVIGHIATLPIQLSCQSQLYEAYWVVGFIVLPEYRNGPIGPLLIKKVNETLDLALTLHVEEAPLRIFKGLGWKHTGMIPQFVYLLNPYAFLKNIRIGQLSFLHQKIAVRLDWLEFIVSQPLARFFLALCSSVVLKTFTLSMTLRRPRPGSGEVVEETGFETAYDALWERVGSKFAALVVRDRAYLEARYGKRMKNYRILAYRRHNQLLGYCIVKVKQFYDDVRMGGIRVGVVVDCLFDPADLQGLQSLLGGTMRFCKKEAVDVIFCTASYLPLQELLSCNGFIKVPGNLNFAYYDKKNSIRPDLSLASWHLMRGDSDADQNF